MKKMEIPCDVRTSAAMRTRMVLGDEAEGKVIEISTGDPLLKGPFVHKKEVICQRTGHEDLWHHQKSSTLSPLAPTLTFTL